MRIPVVAVLLALASAAVHAQSLQEAFGVPARKPVDSYVFVSTKLPDATLIALARDAQRSGSTLVLNGYMTAGATGMKDTTRRVLEISRICCGEKVPHWQVNPLLFQRYRVATVPAFVLAKGTGTNHADYTKVTGEMGLSNALKFVAQESKNADLVKAATAIYTRSYATQ